MATLHETVLEAMRTERAMIDRLSALLEREREVLKQRDSEGLERVAADKEAALTELAGVGEQRMQAVSEAGYAPDETGMRAFLDSVSDSTALRTAWDDLREKLAECQRQNQINGQILHGTADHTRRLLSVLVGASSPDNDLYDRQGGKVSPLGGRTHTKA